MKQPDGLNETFRAVEKNFDDFAEIFSALKLIGFNEKAYLSSICEIDKLPDYLWIHDENLTIFYGNTSFLKNFDRCIKKTCYHCLMGESEPCSCCLSQKALATNRTERCSLCKRHNAGYDLNIYHTPITNDNGQKFIMKSSFHLEETSSLANSLRVVRESEGRDALFLTMCSACNRVRDKHNKWINLDDTIIDNANVRISHGICTECRELLYPDL